MKFADAVQQRLDDVDYSVAAQRLEGLTVPADTVENLRRVARGEMTTEQCLEHVRNKYAKAPHR